MPCQRSMMPIGCQDGVKHQIVLIAKTGAEYNLRLSLGGIGNGSRRSP